MLLELLNRFKRPCKIALVCWDSEVATLAQKLPNSSGL